MKVIGITGGVGAGKSTILTFLSENFNSRVLMADDLAKSLQKKGEVCYEPLVQLLGTGVLDQNEEIDKKKMSLMIFNDSKLLEQVNNIIHPLVKEYILNLIDELKTAGNVDYFFLEAALLIETGYKEIVDELWYIYTDVAVRRERLKASRGYSDEKIDSILQSQLSDEEYRANCDFVIDNSFDPEYSFKSICERMTTYGNC